MQIGQGFESAAYWPNLRKTACIHFQSANGSFQTRFCWMYKRISPESDSYLIFNIHQSPNISNLIMNDHFHNVDAPLPYKKNKNKKSFEEDDNIEIDDLVSNTENLFESY